MRREQIIISIAAVALIFTLYQLPKVVVDNDPETIGNESNTDTSGAHDIEMPDSVVSAVGNLRMQLTNLNGKEIISIFADSLARTFLIYNYLDSAVRYAELIVALDSSKLSEKAGDIYYKAYGLAGSEGDAMKYGARAREIYSELLLSENRTDLEARIAMTRVIGENPMEGILKLRELAENNPNNVEAQYNLGLLSIQSGQFDRAVSRFEKVIEIEPANIEAYFYLGVSNLELGNESRAKELFGFVITNGNDPAITRLVEDYLRKIN